MSHKWVTIRNAVVSANNSGSSDRTMQEFKEIMESADVETRSYTCRLSSISGLFFPENSAAV
ncbi:MAG: hypothetical protein VZR00_07435 [Lachnospiraceae bacterium]|nr:hypothetical protein [Lachnospiraceae bacterium]MEE3461699.1 hypothetical protein [Lachnospiraceae bacterium]